MNTADPGRRVALLARPGAARDCVRAALLEIGADLVAEEDPTSAEPQSVQAAAPQVLLIVLDAAAEDALGRFDAVIGDPAVEVMFEEADVAVAREGWEAARWRRHLAAKLHGSADVLPPVAGAGALPAVDGLSLQIEELMAADMDGGDAAMAIELPADATGGQDFSIYDPAALDADVAQDYTLGVDGLAFDPVAFDAGTFEAFDTDAPLDSPGLPPVTGPDFSASDFDPLLAELDAQQPDVSAPAWDAGSVESIANADEAIAASATTRGFGELSLADDPAPAPPRARAAHDLQDLERRISGLQLVDDSAPASATPASASTATSPPAPAGGVVLAMAGLGGPDAVRQFLGGLPADFRAPVLVRQRLDGARYDKLVAQMQRATAVTVALAEAGGAITGGTVYVVGDDLGLDRGDGLRFAAGSGLVDSLPPGSAVVLLSGSDVADVDRVAGLAGQGAWLGAQSAEGCYDPAAPQALAARGAVSAAPAELARQLAQRWSA